MKTDTRQSQSSFESQLLAYFKENNIKIVNSHRNSPEERVNLAVDIVYDKILAIVLKKLDLEGEFLTTKELKDLAQIADGIKHSYDKIPDDLAEDTISILEQLKTKVENSFYDSAVEIPVIDVDDSIYLK